MSLEDMISHFGFCIRDSSFAKFVCSFCHSCVTSEEILKTHINRSHRYQLNKRKENSESSLDLSLLYAKEEVSKDEKIACESQVYLKNISPISNKSKEKFYESYNQTDSGKDKYNNSKQNTKKISLSMKGINTRKRKTESTPCKGLSKSQDKADVSPKVIDEPQLLKNKNASDEEKEEIPIKKKRGRKPKQVTSKKEEKPIELTEKEVQCGKCKDFKGSIKSFQEHNFKKHVNLGWIEGEIPVDLNDEKEVIKLVRAAFKLTKKATCEHCQDVKKSFLGFATHIQTCGKTKEEKDALKVQCPYCPAKCLKYSMPMHIKLSHSDKDEDFGNTAVCSQEDPLQGIFPRKRRSALRAASKFQEVLKEFDEPDSKFVNYLFYEKNTGGKFPKVCSRLTNFWYKCQREKKPIPCRHENCENASSTVEEAKRHHYTCSRLPDAVYMCETCAFYSVNESDLISHVSVNHKRIWKKKREGDELDEAYIQKESDLEDYGNGNGSDEDDENSSQDEASDSDDGTKAKKRKHHNLGNDAERRKRKSGDVKELYYKKLFCKRGNIENRNKIPYFYNTLKITLEEELNESKDNNLWPDFQTEMSDWKKISLESDSDSNFLPKLTHSISVDVRGTNRNFSKWRRFKRFEGDLVDGLPIMFTGGSVRCMSWCKVSYHRSIAKKVKQFLALATTSHLNHLRNIKDQSESCKMSLLQIWDCGILKNKQASDPPKFSYGIRHEGEIWDLSWFPEDTSCNGCDQWLSRLGLLATAADDGIVRIWSICDPDQLISAEGYSVYDIHPVAKLVTDEDIKDSCFRLAIGKNGVVAGGFGNGIVAFWTLKSFSSPFCEKEAKCGVIRPFLTIHAHKTAIMSLTFCPNESRYITSGALDGIVKIWDLESPLRPIEQFNRELCLGSCWPRNWPLIICNFDDFLSPSNKGVVKFIQDMFYDKHYSCLILDNLCLSLSFNDWLNILCGSNALGDVRISLLQNFIWDQKKNRNNYSLSSLHLETLDDIPEEKNAIGKSAKEYNEPSITALNYDEIISQFGLVFSDGFTKRKIKLKKAEYHFEEIPIKAVNKVCFNPNFESFTHVAAGYNCGLVRILRLNSLQSNYYMKNFIEAHNKHSV